MSVASHECPWRERKSFAKIKAPLDIPDLIETQQRSYSGFLQEDELPDQRKDIGLHQAFSSIFPIKGRDGTSLEYINYTLGRPKYDEMECIDRGMTFASPVRIRVRLVVRQAGATKDEEPTVVDIREEDIYLGEIPLMTTRGTFIVNGAERVVVSQLHRSPGATFNVESHHSGQRIIQASVIPNRGAWLEFENDLNDVLSVIIDRRRKLPATVLLRSFDYETDEAIFDLFIKQKEIKVSGRTRNQMLGKPISRDVVDEETNATVIEAGTEITEATIEKLNELGIGSVYVSESHPRDFNIIRNTILKDNTSDKETALAEIYQTLRPGEPPSLKNALALFENLFTKERRYDLSRVGRYRMNKKLGIEVDLDTVTLTAEDVVGVVSHILDLNRGEDASDDIDHLGNRRVRTIGELLENQVRAGLARMERTIKEKMGILDMENVMPRNLINAKPITTAISDFYARSQLSQFLDQINPLSELTHKRRLSALGPGGLNRERAGFEVRDVHHTHYGRVCPIETPEGPNIGLISSLSTFARVNEFGFIETPYRKVKNGVVSKDIEYLTADDEDNNIIAQANAPIDAKGKFQRDDVLTRYRGNFPRVAPAQVNFMDVSPLQLVSISAALIPFLEHDDANRALMGSNMQRQAVPLLRAEAPLVGTGMEYRAAKDSGVVVVARRAGTVDYVAADQIIIRPDDAESERDVDTYRLAKFIRSNQNTCVNQKPIVRLGQHVEAGWVIADGPATDKGELALGKNVLVAFMSWEGANFEDAIIVSERLIHKDAFTSVHIEEFKVEARDTKLGEEEITRDIPNVGEEALRNLDENGVIRIGAQVNPGDILVGKISPKGKVQTSNVEKLLRAIFGKRAEDVKDISLKASPGTKGVVVDVKVYSRKMRAGRSRAEDERAIKRLLADRETKLADLEADWKERVTNSLMGSELSGDIVHPMTGEILVSKGKKFTKNDLDKMQDIDLRDVHVEGDDGLERIRMDFERSIEHVQQQYEKQVEYIKTGDNLPPGVLKMVKVYIAKKKKLSIGDKMAGRHGNKGVISRIVPIEDMPHLEDGTPVDIILNPLGVPSRMNVGQIFETHLGWAIEKLGMHIATPVFDGAHVEDVLELLEKAELPVSGKTTVIDGRTGEAFKEQVTVGKVYMLKLNHLVDDKIHARSIGPYSLVTQQPLGGKAQFGGQRLGEMEVWALEAYGAAHTLQELLTVKSDDITGRNRIYEAIVKGKNARAPGIPESFYVLIKELQSLGLGVELIEGESDDDDDSGEAPASKTREERDLVSTEKD